MVASDYIAIVSAAIAAVSIGFSIYTYYRSNQRDERIRQISEAQARYDAEVQSLLGSKETVGFTAFSYLMDGLPETPNHRKNAIRALCAAAVFERSDRARSLIFAVLKENYAKDRKEIDRFLSLFESNIKQLDDLSFSKEELDLSSPRHRASAIRKLLADGPGVI